MERSIEIPHFALLITAVQSIDSSSITNTSDLWHGDLEISSTSTEMALDPVIKIQYLRRLKGNFRSKKSLGQMKERETCKKMSHH